MFLKTLKYRKYFHMKRNQRSLERHGYLSLKICAEIKKSYVLLKKTGSLLLIN